MLARMGLPAIAAAVAARGAAANPARSVFADRAVFRDPRAKPGGAVSQARTRLVTLAALVRPDRQALLVHKAASVKTAPAASSVSPVSWVPVDRRATREIWGPSDGPVYKATPARLDIQGRAEVRVRRDPWVFLGDPAKTAAPGCAAWLDLWACRGQHL